MVPIRNISAPEEKSRICDAILRALPSWFGIESSIIGYVDEVRSMPFFAAYDGEAPVGFAALKGHNPITSEICVMGVLREYHRQGIGRRLIEACEELCRERKTEFLTVKTLAEAHESKSYAKTRLFYMSMGFKPLEVFPLLWDESNPCLFMVKVLDR